MHQHVFSLQVPKRRSYSTGCTLLQKREMASRSLSLIFLCAGPEI